MGIIIQDIKAHQEMYQFAEKVKNALYSADVTNREAEYIDDETLNTLCEAAERCLAYMDSNYFKIFRDEMGSGGISNRANLT